MGLHAVLHDAGAEPARDDADRPQQGDAEDEQRAGGQAPAATRPCSNAGSTTWSVAQPSTQASATVIAPKSALASTATVNLIGSERIATQRTWSPCA